VPFWDFFGGYVIAEVISSFDVFTVVISYKVFLVAIFISVVLALIFGVAPAKKASEINPIKAIRS